MGTPTGDLWPRVSLYVGISSRPSTSVGVSAWGRSFVVLVMEIPMSRPPLGLFLFFVVTRFQFSVAEVATVPISDPARVSQISMSARSWYQITPERMKYSTPFFVLSHQTNRIVSCLWAWWTHTQWSILRHKSGSGFPRNWRHTTIMGPFLPCGMFISYREVDIVLYSDDNYLKPSCEQT